LRPNDTEKVSTKLSDHRTKQKRHTVQYIAVSLGQLKINRPTKRYILVTLKSTVYRLIHTAQKAVLPLHFYHELDDKDNSFW